MHNRATPRQVLAVHVPIAVVGIALLVVLWENADWKRWELILGLGAVAVAGALRPINLGPIALDSHLPAAIAAIALVGPAPATLIALVACVVGDLGRKPWHYAFLNASSSLLWTGAAAALVNGALVAGWVSADDASIALAVFGAGLAGNFVNFVCMLPSTAFEGTRPLVVFRTIFWPVAPLEVLSVLLGAATVALYGVAGWLAVASLGMCIAALLWVLELLERGTRNERSLQELSAELLTVGERERQKLAATLHDDALQRLASAGQDLTEALAGDKEMARRTQAQIAATMQSLRALMVELDTSAAPALTVQRAIAKVAERSSLSIAVSVDPSVAEDETVVACVGELLGNVAKHARASRAWVTVSAQDGLAVIEVADDGQGGAPDLHEAVANGHMGLALVSRRARSRSGDLFIGSRPGGGLFVRVLVRTADGVVS